MGDYLDGFGIPDDESGRVFQARGFLASAVVMIASPLPHRVSIGKVAMAPTSRLPLGTGVGIRIRQLKRIA